MKHRDESANIRFGEAIKDFLSCPTDRRKFKAFYSICFNHTIAYLRFLKSHGWSLPIEKAEKENPLIDIAIDILGPLLRSRPNQPFFMIFAYYKRHGIDDPESADPTEIMWLLSVLIRGHTKKELGKLRVDRDAGAENLERRFKDILRGDEYSRISDKSQKSDFVFCRKYENDLRLDKQLLPSGELTVIVNESFARSRNRKEWCQGIFESLNARSEFRNCFIFRDLLNTIIAASSEHIELYGWRPTILPTPEMSLVENDLQEARKKALEMVKTTRMQKFIDRGKITKIEADAFLSAADQYLIDLGQNGQADSIPEYFRLAMPENSHCEYLDRYKYVFETVMNEAAEEFRRILKE